MNARDLVRGLRRVEREGRVGAATIEVLRRAAEKARDGEEDR